MTRDDGLSKIRNAENPVLIWKCFNSLLSVLIFSVDNGTSWGPKRPHKYNVFSDIGCYWS